MRRMIHPERASLAAIKRHLEQSLKMTCTIRQDQWLVDGEIRITPGRVCVVVHKNPIAGAKVNLVEPGVVDIRPIAPSTFVNMATQRGLLALIIHLLIRGFQNRVAESVEDALLQLEPAPAPAK